jgi:hypothetical protein
MINNKRLGGKPCFLFIGRLACDRFHHQPIKRPHRIVIGRRLWMASLLRLDLLEHLEIAPGRRSAMLERTDSRSLDHVHDSGDSGTS